MTPPADPERYKNHRFPGEIISHGVWLYDRFPLSYRDVQELLCERGIDVTHEAIRQWCLKSLNLSLFVAHTIWPRRGVSPRRYRAHCLQRRASLRHLLVSTSPSCDLLQTAIH